MKAGTTRSSRTRCGRRQTVSGPSRLDGEFVVLATRRGRWRRNFPAMVRWRHGGFNCCDRPKSNGRADHGGQCRGTASCRATRRACAIAVIDGPLLILIGRASNDLNGIRLDGCGIGNLACATFGRMRACRRNAQNAERKKQAYNEECRAFHSINLAVRNLDRTVRNRLHDGYRDCPRGKVKRQLCHNRPRRAK